MALGIACCLTMVVPARIFADSLPSASHLFVGEARQHVGRRLLEAGTAWWVLYVIGVVALLRAPRRLGAAVGVLTSAGVGLASLARAATTSSDFYRYAWDGRVQAAGIDPYRYAPSAPQLDRLHTSWLWPNAATCAVHRHPPGCTLINRATVHTIYPPLAQLWFLIEHYTIPQSTRDRGYEAVGLLVVVATSLLLMAFLSRTGRDIRHVAIWGCCPAVAIEAVQNAHIDGLAVVFVVLAVWMAERESWTWAAAAIGAAGLVKLYPLVLFPAIIQQRRIRSAIVIAAMFVIGYLPHILAVGDGVTGFLGTYIHNRGTSAVGATSCSSDRPDRPRSVGCRHRRRSDHPWARIAETAGTTGPIGIHRVRGHPLRGEPGRALGGSLPRRPGSHDGWLGMADDCCLGGS